MNIKVKGYLKSFIYRNEENGYIIARINTIDNEELTITGYFPILNEEQLYEFSGSIVDHPRYGEQLKVENYLQIEDLSEKGLVSFLSSDEFDGIGPVTASKIVKLLGINAIDKIIEDDQVLRPILNAKRSKNLKNQLIKNKNIHDIYIQLFDYGISNRIAAKLYKEYEDLTIQKLNENPFRLMDELYGFGFIKSLDIALKMGIKKDELVTIKAAITFVLRNNAYSTGNLYLSKEDISNLVNKLLQINIDIDIALTELEKEAKIIINDNNYFLTEIYQTELDIAIEIKRLYDQKSYQLNEVVIDNFLFQFSLNKGINYTNTQISAIKESLKNSLTIITGGPGTGKTTLIEGIINLYAHYYKFNIKGSTAKHKIGLMAPTGRAAKRMKEILEFDAMTIHRHLGYDYDNLYKKNRFDPLEYNLIIIDEASMIDIFLAKRLFEAISNNTQVIIVGDEDQLPSVGPGNVLGDLIRSNLIPVIRLKEIHRQAKDSYIIKLASLINEQKLDSSDLYSKDDVIFYNGSIHDIKKIILSQINGALKQGYNLIEDIQILIPLYKGDLGINAINNLIQKNFNPSFEKGLKMTYGEYTYYENDKVIQLVNDRENEVMNGDIGIIKKIFIEPGRDSKLIMQIEFDEQIVYYNQSELDNINLAYVISIHKSQGSEYKIVFLPIIKSYLHMLKKQLIYTAVTRSKQYLFLLGDMSLLTYASNQLEDLRKTFLVKHLNKLFNISTGLFNELENDEDPLKDLSPYDLLD